MNYTSKPLSKITVPENRLRELRDYSGLAASMAEVGLLQPITITEGGRLVAGRHRVEAARSLGWETIAAFVVEEDALTNRLAEIDENLQRFDLTVYEQAKHAEERERVLEAMGQRATPSNNQHAPATAAGAKTTADVARDAGMSERSWQGRVQIGRGLGEQTRTVLDQADTSDESQRKFLNSKSQLDHLVNISGKRGDDQAAQTAEKVLNGEFKSTFDAYPEVKEGGTKTEKPEPAELESTEPEDADPTIGELFERHGVSLDDRPKRTPEEEAFFPVQRKAREIRAWDSQKYAKACPEVRYLDDAIENFEELKAWVDRAIGDLKEERRKSKQLRAVE